MPRAGNDGSNTNCGSMTTGARDLVTPVAPWSVVRWLLDHTCLPATPPPCRNDSKHLIYCYSLGTCLEKLGRLVVILAVYFGYCVTAGVLVWTDEGRGILTLEIPSSDCCICKVLM